MGTHNPRHDGHGRIKSHKTVDFFGKIREAVGTVNTHKGKHMKSILIFIRNIAIVSVVMVVGIYATVLLQIKGVLPESELSRSVVTQVLANSQE